jgi:dihydroorotase
MKKLHCYLLFAFLVFWNNALLAQQYDIVIKGGHVIDPKNNIDAIRDIAISAGKIVQLASNIDEKQGAQ